MFKAQVTQYVPPHGRQIVGFFELVADRRMDYDDMVSAGCRLEAEMLSTGEVSVTVANLDVDLDIEIVPNGPQVILATERMLARRSWVTQGSAAG